MEIRQLDRRRADERGKLRKVDRPISEPDGLVKARARVDALRSAHTLATWHLDGTQAALDHLQETRPRGPWAWITRKTARHAETVAAAAVIRDQARRRLDGTAAALADPARRLAAREAGWAAKVEAIEADRAEQRKVIIDELRAIAEARERLKEERAALTPKPRPKPPWITGRAGPRYVPR